MSDFNVTYKTRNVNSKRLLKEFKQVVEEVCNEYIFRQATLLDRTYSYEELSAFLHMYLEDLMEKGTITQFDVITDQRINSPVDVHAGRIKALITFRQTNCLNVTEILINFSI